MSNKHERGIAKLLWFEGTSGDDVVQPLNKRATLLAKTASACLSYTVGFWFTVKNAPVWISLEIFNC